MDMHQLNVVLEKHEQWLRGEEGGEIAILSHTDLGGVDLSGYDLGGVDFRGSNLREANLSGADLLHAHLRGANLRHANLSAAHLFEANLRFASLRGADLSGADLCGVNLREADLRRADLRGANLRHADLCGADLTDVKGFLLLPVQDMRGYSFAHAVETDDGWRIRMGCRDFSIEEAREHWGGGYKGDREQGDIYLYAVDWLERKVQEGE